MEVIHYEKETFSGELIAQFANTFFWYNIVPIPNYKATQRNHEIFHKTLELHQRYTLHKLIT